MDRERVIDPLEKALEHETNVQVVKPERMRPPQNKRKEKLN